MISLLRKFRRELMNQNRFGKYLLYAFGEIILVVIGILIALQINNWNQQKALEKKDKEIAAELYSELLQNLAYTQQEVKYAEERLQFTMDMIALCTSPDTIIEQRDFDRTLIQVLGFSPYSPFVAQAQEISSSDQFEFMRSPDLDKTLAQYTSSVSTVQEYYTYNSDTWKMVMQPYLIENYNLLPIQAFWLDIEMPDTATTANYQRLMADPAFRNICSAIYGDVAAYIWVLSDNLGIINELISRLETDYPTVMSSK